MNVSGPLVTTTSMMDEDGVVYVVGSVGRRVSCPADGEKSGAQQETPCWSLRAHVAPR